MKRALARLGARHAVFAALLLSVTALFVHTVDERRPWFGRASDGHHFWLTAHSLTVIENWCEEGLIRSRLTLFDHPASVEHQSVQQREPYVSYPLGSLVPPYLLARLSGCEPTPALLMGYDLANHLAVALLLAGLGFALASAVSRSLAAALLFGLLPASVLLLTPGPMYWMQNVYFADQAVLAPFAAALLLEWLREEPGRRGRVARVLQPVVVFFGCTVDYLFVFVTLGLLLRRWLSGEYRSARGWRFAALGRFTIAPLAALALFALQLAAADGLGVLIGRARWRAGGTVRGEPVSTVQFWLGHAVEQYGEAGVAAIIGATLALAGWWAIGRRRTDDQPVSLRSRIVGLALLASLPCFAQIYALRNHSAVHDFSALKLALPLALVPGVALPLAVLAGRRSSRGAVRWTATVAAALALVYLAFVHPRFAVQFPEPTVGGGEVAELLRRHTGYADIVFSPDFEIPRKPPQLLAIARNRVYRVTDPAAFRREATRHAGALDEPHRVDLLFRRGLKEPWRHVVRRLEPVTDGQVELYLDVPRPRWFRAAEAREPAVGAAGPP